jgi:hypothetical protein
MHLYEYIFTPPPLPFPSAHFCSEFPWWHGWIIKLFISSLSMPWMIMTCICVSNTITQTDVDLLPTWDIKLILTTQFLVFVLLSCYIVMKSPRFILLAILQIYASEESNQHSGAFVFLLGQLLSSIPFLFLISISSSLVFYFLIGLQDEFSLLMYFVLNFFMCLLVNEGLMLLVVSLWQDVFWSILTLVSIHVSYDPEKNRFINFRLAFLSLLFRKC